MTRCPVKLNRYCCICTCTDTSHCNCGD